MWYEVYSTCTSSLANKCVLGKKREKNKFIPFSNIIYLPRNDMKVTPQCCWKNLIPKSKSGLGFLKQT